MFPLKSHVSDDIFLHIPPSSPPPSLSASVSPPATLIFFITGNPGLISYYHPFLSSLSTAPSTAALGCAIAGFSLGGFETSPLFKQTGSVDEYATLRELQFPGPDGGFTGPKDEGRGVYGLLKQIELCYARVDALVRRLRVQQPTRDDEEEDEDGRREKGEEARKEDEDEEEIDRRRPMDVILMGHSVGAYIALEAIRLWKERHPTSPLWIPKAAMLLMPTIIDLHKSPSGQLAMPVLSTVPFLPEAMQLAASFVKLGMPQSWLEAVVAKVTGMKPGEGLESTVKFLLSPKGVKQALHLARDELATIRADKWGAEIWGVRRDAIIDSEDGSRIFNRDSPDLYFLFAKDDHWIADTTRNEILQGRAGEGGKGILDREDGLVHAWCLRQSQPVSKIAMAWLEEILRERRKIGKD